MAGTSQAELAASQLDRETEADRHLYSDLLARSKQVAIQREIQEPDARVVSPPSLAVNPSFPRRGLLFVIAAAAAAVVAGGLALLLDRLRQHTATLDEIEAHHGITGLGGLPRVRGLRRGDAGRNHALLRHPRLANAMQAVGNSIAFRMRDRRSKMVVVTSPGRGEDRTSLALLLARSLAGRGERVLLVDADLRRRGVTRRLGLDAAPGLVGAVRATTGLQASIVADEATPETAGLSFDVLPAGPEGADPHAVLHRPALRLLLAEARTRYDAVIIDTPPLAEVDDALALVGEADATVVVVRCGRTSDDALQAMLRRLQLASAHVVGAVLNATTADAQGVVRRPGAGGDTSVDWAKTYLAQRG